MAADVRPPPRYWPIWKPRPRPAPQPSVPFLAQFIAQVNALAPALPGSDRVSATYARAWDLLHPRLILGPVVPFASRA